MKEKKIQRSVNMLHKLGVEDKNILILRDLNLIVGKKPSEGTLYFVTKFWTETVYFSELIGISYDTKIHDSSSGSLGGTLIGGALFGDIGAIFGSGLLSESSFVKYFIVTVRLRRDKFKITTRIDDNEDDIEDDYQVLKDFLKDIITTNKTLLRSVKSVKK